MKLSNKFIVIIGILTMMTMPCKHRSGNIWQTPLKWDGAHGTSFKVISLRTSSRASLM